MDENCGARLMLIMQHKTDNARPIMKQHWKCQTDHTYLNDLFMMTRFKISICFLSTMIETLSFSAKKYVE